MEWLLVLTYNSDDRNISRSNSGSSNKNKNYYSTKCHIKQSNKNSKTEISTRLQTHSYAHSETHTYTRLFTHTHTLNTKWNKIFEADNKLNTSKTMTNNKAVIKSIGQNDWQTNRRTDGRSDEHIEWRWITYHDDDLTLTHHLKHLHKYSPKHICMYTQQDWGEYFERIKKMPKKTQQSIE